MRELNECKAEIFRRSKKRIQARKKRRAWLISLCLCFVVCASAYSLAESQTKKSNDQAPDGLTGSVSNGSYVCSYTQVSVQTGDEVKFITDKVAVTNLFEIIFVPDSSHGQESADESQNEMDGVLDLPNYSSHSADYVITFQTAFGAQSIFLLNGNELYSVTGKTATTLTNAQRAELLAALGVSD